jgi:hypothetical protein
MNEGFSTKRKNAPKKDAFEKQGRKRETAHTPDKSLKEINRLLQELKSAKGEEIYLSVKSRKKKVQGQEITETIQKPQSRVLRTMALQTLKKRIEKELFVIPVTQIEKEVAKLILALRFQVNARAIVKGRRPKGPKAIEKKK